MSGDNARMTFARSDDQVRQHPVELWWGGGARHLVLDVQHQTYYDAAHDSMGDAAKRPVPTIEALSFRVSSVSTANVTVDLQTDPTTIEMFGLQCARITLKVSYQLRIALGEAPIRATVSTVAQFYVTEELAVPRLAFGHGAISLSTSFEEPDRAIAARLAPLRGVAVKKVVEVTRQFEGSTPFTETLTESLQGFRPELAPDSAFELPSGFRYQERSLAPPRKTKNVPPAYPTDAQRARIQGVVLIEAMIGPDGKVQDARVIRSIPELDQAAIHAVRKWRYTPAVLDGQAVPVVMTVTVSFSLQ